MKEGTEAAGDKAPAVGSTCPEDPETLADLLAGRTGGISFEPRDLARNHHEHVMRILESDRCGDGNRPARRDRKDRGRT